MALPDRFTIEPVWAGVGTAVIIGGGPSLTLKQIRAIARARLTRANDFRVIAVNDAVYAAWFADWLHACDGTWWREHIFGVHAFPGIKTTLDETIPAPWVTGYLENSGNEGFDPDPSRCRTGGNGVYQAICICIHLGVKSIVLAGVDMKDSPTGEKHWFGDHPEHFCGGHRRAIKVDFARNMLWQFPTLLPTLAERGIEVLNINLDSALETFKKIPIEQALR